MENKAGDAGLSQGQQCGEPHQSGIHAGTGGSVNV